MKINITKRMATEADTDFARKTHHEAFYDVVVRQFGSWEEKMQDDFFAKSWKPETHEIIFRGGEKVGYCFIERLPDYIFVRELVLSPKCQRQGIGSMVLKDLIEESETKNMPIRLQVLKENEAQNLYRKLGFKDIGSTDRDIQMEFEP